MNGLSLDSLAAQINEQHHLAERTAHQALEYAREAGELLIKAKQKVEHGQWLPWIDANLHIGSRQAQKYMKLASNWDAISKTNSDSHLTIDTALKEIRHVEAKPTTGEYMYLKQADHEYWIWPYNDEYFHYAEITNMGDETGGCAASKKPFSWDGVIKHFPITLAMKKVNGFPSMGLAVRELSLGSIFNCHVCGNYNPRLEWVPWHYEEPDIGLTFALK